MSRGSDAREWADVLAHDLTLVSCTRHRASLRAETCVARYTARVEWAHGAGLRGAVRHPDCQGCPVGALRASVAAAAETARWRAPRSLPLLGSTPRNPEGDSR
jgi:hypothetical protein